MEPSDFPLARRKAAAKKCGLTRQGIDARICRGEADWETRIVPHDWRTRAARKGKANSRRGDFTLPGSKNNGT